MPLIKSPTREKRLMLGKDFTPGVVFKDFRIWVRVRTRGPVISKSKGHDGAIVRLTTEDRDGNLIGRSMVYAESTYETRTDFPGARKGKPAAKAPISFTDKPHVKDAADVAHDIDHEHDDDDFTDEELAAIPKVAKLDLLFSEKKK